MKIKLLCIENQFNGCQAPFLEIGKFYYAEVTDKIENIKLTNGRYKKVLYYKIDNMSTLYGDVYFKRVDEIREEKVSKILN